MVKSPLSGSNLSLNSAGNSAKLVIPVIPKKHKSTDKPSPLHPSEPGTVYVFALQYHWSEGWQLFCCSRQWHLYLDKSRDSATEELIRKLAPTMEVSCMNSS